jgi:hypothetical protein
MGNIKPIKNLKKERQTTQWSEEERQTIQWSEEERQKIQWSEEERQTIQWSEEERQTIQWSEEEVCRSSSDHCSLSFFWLPPWYLQAFHYSKKDGI